MNYENLTNEQAHDILKEMYEKETENPHPNTVKVHDITDDGKLGEVVTEL